MNSHHLVAQFDHNGIIHLEPDTCRFMRDGGAFLTLRGVIAAARDGASLCPNCAQ